MFTHPDRIGQLAAEHHQHMLAQARQRTLQHQHGRRSARMPDAVARITRRLTAAITRTGVVAEETPGATWSARPHQLSGSATEAQPSSHGH